jgi:hypothetical protein
VCRRRDASISPSRSWSVQLSAVLLGDRCAMKSHRTSHPTG